jgi:hypothetical protein
MSAQYAVITLSELPPSVNKMYGNNKKSSGRGRYKTPYYLAWIESSGWEIRDQKPPHVAGPYCMTMRCGRKNKRADISNIIKACEDLVVAHHVTSAAQEGRHESQKHSKTQNNILHFLADLSLLALRANAGCVVGWVRRAWFFVWTWARCSRHLFGDFIYCKYDGWIFYSSL